MPLKCYPGRMQTQIPKKLSVGDTIRIVAPSNSLSIISNETRNIANARLQALGLNITFSEHAEEKDEYSSSSIQSRVDDLHAAFRDPSVKAIFSVIGGFNSNQLLSHLDWNLIKNNPKIFIGYSDTTALENAMYTKAGLITYSGPAYSTFGQDLYFEYTLEYFIQCLMNDAPIILSPAADWTDDRWYLDQKNRTPISNEGWYEIQEGEAEGVILGGNLSTFRLLQGTEYFPDLTDSVLFIEDDENSPYVEFDRSIQALIHAPEFEKVRGLVLGRFQNMSSMTRQKIQRLISNKKELSHIPVIANVDFGHTSPIITFPIGGRVSIKVTEYSSTITIDKH